MLAGVDEATGDEATGDEATGDGQHWAQARSLLERTPTEAAQRRLRRWRRQRIGALAALLLVSAAVGTAIAVLFGGGASEAAKVPAWQQAAGFSIAGAGLVLQLTGVVATVRRTRGLRAWRSPLAVLTTAQRKQLAAQVRGRLPVDAEQLPLARLVAEQLLVQRTGMAAHLGLEVLFIGQWIADPSTARAAIAGSYGLLLAVLWPLLHRDVRAARRFLGTHLVPRT